MSQEEEFLEFLEQYKNLIFKISGIYCRKEEDRKDLIQEIILQLWKSFPHYDPKYALSTWAYRIALNISISYVRKTRTRNNALQQYKSSISLIEVEADDKFQRKKLYDSIAFLKPIDKAIISMHLDGCDNKEISTVLGMSVSNVSTRLSRIRQELKKHFTNNKLA